MYNIRYWFPKRFICAQTFTEYNGKIYFKADDGTSYVNEMWVFDPANDASSS